MVDSDAGIAKVFSEVPALIVFWRVTGPLGTVLKVVTVQTRVDDFF